MVNSTVDQKKKKMLKPSFSATLLSSGKSSRNFRAQTSFYTFNPSVEIIQIQVFLLPFVPNPVRNKFQLPLQQTISCQNMTLEVLSLELYHQDCIQQDFFFPY